MNALYDRDADPALLAGKTIAIVGYGSQGRAQARNLRDSGLAVVAGLRDGSPSRKLAGSDGVPFDSIESAVACANIVMLLAPDEDHAAIFATSIEPHLRRDAYLGVAHGFAVHYGSLVAPPHLNVFLVAPKGPGKALRSEYEAGRGLMCLIGVARDPSGDSQAVALAYACAIGGGRAGILETTFREETETDLFSEQAIICGGLSQLVTAGFETLVEAGYAPEIAYLECLHEVKLIADLMNERGVEGMREAISNTAKFGDYTRGSRVVGEPTRAAMRSVLNEIRSGAFAREWVAENAAGKPRFTGFRAAAAAHPIEAVGRRVRALMPWLGAAPRPPVAASEADPTPHGGRAASAR